MRKAEENQPEVFQIFTDFVLYKLLLGRAAGLWILFAVSSPKGWLCRPSSLLPSFSLANHTTSLCHRFSSRIKQEPSPPSESLGELIKACSGMRLMPIVQGVVKTLSGVRFSHPSRRRMSGNWSRCREELLGEATEKITDGRMVFLGRSKEKKPYLYGLARKEGWD